MSTSEQRETPTMRAMVATEWGAPNVLAEQQVDKPEPGPTEIRVAVHAVGINPVDWKSRQSGSFDLWGDPVIIGWDVSGTVEAVGYGASLFEVGDEVIGMPLFPKQAGAYAEFVVAPSRQFIKKPEGLSHVEGASLPLVGLTAWQGLVEVGGVNGGERVLIHAAGGGLGHIAVQLAKARGAYVIGTASPDKHEWLASLGADELIDYRSVDFAEVARDIDVVLDTVGGDYAERSVKTLRDGGRLVSIAGGEPSEAAQKAAAARGIKTGVTLVEPDRHGLLELAALVEAGTLRPTIAATFPLDRVADAHALGEQGSTAGKIVLTVR
ncbi:MAG: NADP-dependent oxidoreductase [Solirubrobacteraceae bacterium]|nr:NADP-dependent oxidoreductase [Solirubrobacteraceae bacterium]